ncbi:DMT family transporter [Synergistaceae bacterium OttesenSCG-928-D05]|nr:DMT family transporter [Synergistaceae bacterium OttesenSCG-928-D05]
MKKYWTGVVLALAAAVCWGIMSPIAKIVSAAGVSLMTAMVYRGFFVAATVGPLLYVTKGASIFRQSPRFLKFYMLSGFLTVVASGGGFLMSLEYLTVAEALIVHYMFPLVTLAGSCFITHEKPTRLQVLAGFMIVLGVYVGMVSGEKSFAGLSVPGMMWGIFAVIGISGQSLVVRRVAREVEIDQIVLLFYGHLFGAIMLLVGKTFFMGWSDLANITPQVFMLMNVQSLAGSLFAFGCFYTALKYIPAATVSLLCTLEIVTAVALTALLLSIIPTAREVFGCAVIMLAVVFATVKPKEYRENSTPGQALQE